MNHSYSLERAVDAEMMVSCLKLVGGPPGRAMTLKKDIFPYIISLWMISAAVMILWR